jgi:hypothetical protein
MSADMTFLGKVKREVIQKIINRLPEHIQYKILPDNIDCLEPSSF